ncbi:sugar transferase [Candidatus Latescibacterota bacterium]
MYEKFGKRLFDICFSFIGIILLLPLFIAVSVLIKIDSRGAVFFKQKRMGFKEESFFLIKFRSMYSNQEKEKLSFEPGADYRITRFGRILRKTKIDELPQLFNVLKGEMSFVGPRPEVPKYREYFSGQYKRIFTVKPGITDESSIKFIDEEKRLKSTSNPEKYYTEVILKEKLQINYKYAVSKISFKDDIIIILKTLKYIVM